MSQIERLEDEDKPLKTKTRKIAIATRKIGVGEIIIERSEEEIREINTILADKPHTDFLILRKEVLKERIEALKFEAQVLEIELQMCEELIADGDVGG